MSARLRRLLANKGSADTRQATNAGHANATDHFDGRLFFNSTGATGQPFWKLPQMLLTRRTPWPARVPVPACRPPTPASADEVIVTFIGHATFLIQTVVGNVLTDPIFSERASPLRFAGPRRARPPAVPLDDLPAISTVVVSHNHYDHCDVATLRELQRRFQPLFVVPIGNGRLLGAAHLLRVEELDWWQGAAGTPMSVTLTPAQHFSARGPFDRNRALWGGFVLSARGHRIFFAGDTGYAPHFREIGSRLGPIDLALLPIGAYEPRWFMKDIHMNPEEAVRAHLDLGARQSVAMHFGTFPLTPEGIDEPLAALQRARLARGVSDDAFAVLGFGESMRLAGHRSRTLSLPT